MCCANYILKAKKRSCRTNFSDKVCPTFNCRRLPGSIFRIIHLRCATVEKVGNCFLWTFDEHPNTFSDIILDSSTVPSRVLLQPPCLRPSRLPRPSRSHLTPMESWPGARSPPTPTNISSTAKALQPSRLLRLAFKCASPGRWSLSNACASVVQRRRLPGPMVIQLR